MGFVLESPLARTGRGRFVPGAILVVLLALAFWGYRAGRPNLDPDTTSVIAAGVTVLVYTEDFEGATSAVGYEGTLTVLAGQCLGIDRSDGPVLAVFPRGTTARADSGQVSVRVPGDAGSPAATVQPGDPVYFGTITASTSVGDFGGHLDEHTPRACRGLDALGLAPGVSGRE